MNPRTLTQMILALLASAGIVTDEDAHTLLDRAGRAFSTQVLDDLSLQQMIDMLNNPEDPPIIETPDTPKILL